METAQIPPIPPHTFMRSIVNTVIFRRAVTGTKRTPTKSSGLVDGKAKATPIPLSDGGGKEGDVRKRREALEGMLARIFANLSSIKAAYAQIQVAQSPYDPDAIQSADRLVVAELKSISQMKRLCLCKDLSEFECSGDDGSEVLEDSRLKAEIREQRNLLKAFQITTKKLESEVVEKAMEVVSLRDQLEELEKKKRDLESKVSIPKCPILTLDDLHLSGFNPTHFVSVLRYTMKSIRTFVHLLVGKMESSGWNLASAAMAIDADVDGSNLEDRIVAFQSYVSRTMFSNFHLPNFGIFQQTRADDDDDRRRFFNDFVSLKSLKPNQILDPSFKSFHKSKFQATVNTKMLSSFYGKDDDVNFSSISTSSPFLLSFSEMARRVWLLHRLFFSFDRAAQPRIFQVTKGSRFSEVYMETVGSPEGVPVGLPTVAFTVVPGFEVRKTVIQCKVYLSRDNKRSRFV